MSRTARLFQLMQALRIGAPPHTAAVLAQDLGVSARTIHRDIDSLRSLGAVIDGAAGFGFTLIEDATLPPLGFQDEELEALVLGLREVEQIGDPDLASAAGAALGKLQARLPSRQAHRLSHAVLSARRFDRPEMPAISAADLRRATWDELAVDFEYTDGQGAATRRRVDPLGLCYMDRSTVLIGWCHLREAVRVFRLDRMKRLLISDQSFRPRRVPMLREALAQIQEEAGPLAKPRTDADGVLLPDANSR
ncbi:MAG: helix-turn-helix transcriptional regulator [Sedimentitalea sp.]